MKTKQTLRKTKSLILSEVSFCENEFGKDAFLWDFINGFFEANDCYTGKILHQRYIGGDCFLYSGFLYYNEEGKKGLKI